MCIKSKNTFGFSIAIFGLFLFGVTSSAFAHDVGAEIEKVRQATLKYNDIKVALAEGYIPAPPGHCITAASEGLPAKWGGMGIHYINPKLLKITSVKPRVNGMSTHTNFLKPSILLYEPDANGKLMLVGVENLVFLNAWKMAGNQAPPKFAGRSYDTMADDSSTPQDEAHAFEPHMDQHIYFKKLRKPMSQLSPFSPNVTCKNFKEKK